MKYVRRQNATGRYDLYLDMEGMKLPHDDKLEEWKIFPIKTYTKVSNNNSTDQWNVLFKVLNNFYELISDKDKASIGMMLIEMNYKISTFMKTKDLKEELPGLIDELAIMLKDLDIEIDLYKKLVDYCREHIPRSDLSNAGKRAQDTKELTFYDDDVVNLLGVVVLSKLMSPIFGTLMTYLTSNDIESKLKEPHCVSILRKLFDRCCPKLIDKLQYYIKHGIRNEFNEDMTSIHHGLTENSLLNQIFSSLLTRNFVNVDLYIKNGKLMVFVNVSIKKTIQTKKHNMNQHRVMVRCDMTRDDDGNRKSNLEIDSEVSRKTSDIPIIISSSLDRIINSYLTEYEISYREYSQCLAYYRKNTVQITELNKFVLQTFIGPYIGGAKSLRLLGASDVAKIITLLQMICISLGYRELGHMLSANLSDTVKAEATSEDQMLRVNYKNSKYFRNYRSSLEKNISPKQAEKHFDRVIKGLVDVATQQIFIYNTAPFIWESIGESPKYNGKTIQFTDSLIQSICAILLLTSQSV